MRNLKCFIPYFFIAILSSCAGPTYLFTTSLSKVESPTDTKKEYSESKILKFDSEGKANYKYEDENIEIVWTPNNTKILFELKNKTNYTIKIPWDEVVYINHQGQTGRVMHSGVKYIDRNNSQPASIIPKGTILKDLVMPTENVIFYSGAYGGWRELNLFSLPIDKNNFEITKQSWLGQTIKFLIPIMIENVKNEYTFEFKVIDIKKIAPVTHSFD